MTKLLDGFWQMDLTALYIGMSIVAGCLALDVMQVLSQRPLKGLSPLHWAQRLAMAMVACALLLNVMSPLWEAVSPTWGDVLLVFSLLLLFGATSLLNSRLGTRIRRLTQTMPNGPTSAAVR